MLKRIKVRGKLLLLLATPLVAVMVFAASGILDRQDATAFQEREARIAELANAGSDLSLAIQVERIRVLEVERFAMGSDDLVAEDREATNTQFDRWLEAVAAVAGDLALDAEARSLTLDGQRQHDVSVALAAGDPDRPLGWVAAATPAAVPGYCPASAPTT